MTNDDIKYLKSNEQVKFVYKIPNSSINDGFEYVVVGDLNDKYPNTTKYSISEWFDIMGSGSLLCYICSTLPKKYKIKEYLNIYKKPDLLKLRSYISKLEDENSIFKESIWGIQLIKELKVNRVDAYKEMMFDPKKAQTEFFKAVEPMFMKSLDV